VKSLMTPTRRAQRLSRFYPSIWRKRFGAEFIDFMEQSIADTPHDFKRTMNIFTKSARVRLGEFGLVGPTLDANNAPRTALGTSTVLGTIFTIFALFYWSSAMVSWNSNPHVATSLSTSMWMGAITVSTMILALTLFLIGSTAIVHALKYSILKRDKKFAWPLVIVLASTVAIVNAIHQFTRLTIQRGGIQWTQFGIGLKQVAGATQWVTRSIIWGPSWTSEGTFESGVLLISTTISVVALALGVAVLIRRSEFTLSASRAGQRFVKVLALGQVLFLGSFAGWELSGGFYGSWISPFTQMAKSLFFVIAFIALLSVVTSFKVRKRHDVIDIVSSSNVPA
jgi:hypothetical protein